MYMNSLVVPPIRMETVEERFGLLSMCGVITKLYEDQTFSAQGVEMLALTLKIRYTYSHIL